VEAVTNVARHAGVAAANVDLVLLGDRALRVAVHDGGRARAVAARHGAHVDARAVEEIGGSLIVDSGRKARR